MVLFMLFISMASAGRWPLIGGSGPGSSGDNNNNNQDTGGGNPGGNPGGSTPTATTVTEIEEETETTENTEDENTETFADNNEGTTESQGNWFTNLITGAAIGGGENAAWTIGILALIIIAAFLIYTVFFKKKKPVAKPFETKK